MSYGRPIRVFTDLNNPQNMARDFIVSENKFAAAGEFQDTVNVKSVDRLITVTGIGELVLPPDRFSISIKCKSLKENVQDAKNSVTRRVDYVVQTLKNHSLTETDYRIYQHIHHVDSMVCVDCEVDAHFTDLYKCQRVSNLLAEKLGPGVTVSLPHCYHARGSLDKLRRQVGMLAVHNARQKASEMAHVLHLSVGNVVQVQELEASENQGVSSTNEEEPDLAPSIHQRIADNTVAVFSKVSVCIQLKSSKSKKTAKISM